MPTPETVPCQDCRAPVEPEDVHDFRGRAVCEGCFDTAFRALKSAEAVLRSEGYTLRRPRAA